MVDFCLIFSLFIPGLLTHPTTWWSRNRLFSCIMFTNKIFRVLMLSSIYPIVFSDFWPILLFLSWMTRNYLNFLVYHSTSRYFSALNLSCLVIYLSAWLSLFLSTEKYTTAHIFLSVCNKTFFSVHILIFISSNNFQA